MNTRHFFILIMGLALFACSSETEWKHIYTIHDPDKQAGDIYTKPQSIMFNGSKRQFWIKWIYKKEQTTEDKKTYIERLTLSVIDCSQNTMEILESVYYDHANNIVDMDTTPMTPEYTVPNTLSESLSEFVCQYKKSLIIKLFEKINL